MNGASTKRLPNGKRGKALALRAHLQGLERDQGVAQQTVGGSRGNVENIKAPAGVLGRFDGI